MNIFQNRMDTSGHFRPEIQNPNHLIRPLYIFLRVTLKPVEMSDASANRSHLGTTDRNFPLINIYLPEQAPGEVF
jgi:hypothetical protein